MEHTPQTNTKIKWTRKNDHFGQQHCCAANRAESVTEAQECGLVTRRGPHEAEDTAHPMTQVPRGLLWAVCLLPTEHHSSSTTNGLLIPFESSFQSCFLHSSYKQLRGQIHLWWVWAVWLTSAQSIKFSFVFAVNCVRLPGHKHVDLQNSHRSHVAPAAHRLGSLNTPWPHTSSKAGTGAAPGDGPTYPEGRAAAAQRPTPPEGPEPQDHGHGHHRLRNP